MINKESKGVGLYDSTLFNVCCSIEQLSHYWKDSHYVYFEVVDFDSIKPIGFGVIDTSEFGKLLENGDNM